MPYIESSERPQLEMWATQIAYSAKTLGQLNYAISRIMEHWLEGGVSYERLNALVGVLECAKLELYRRVVASYEDIKKAENGDVYGD